MPVLTVAQLQSLAALVPVGAGALTYQVEVPVPALAVVSGRAVDARGNITELVVGYIHLDTLTYNPA